MKSSEAGPFYGLKLDLRVETSFSVNELIVYIHNRSLVPLSLFNKGYSLSSGSKNYFSIDRVYYQSLSHPYTNCINDVNSFNLNKTIINHMSINNKLYSQSDCIQICSYLKILEDNNCGCGTFSRIDFLYEDCILNKNVSNFTKICLSNSFKMLHRQNLINKCSSYCPLECDSMRYLIQTYSQVATYDGGYIQPESFIFGTYPGFNNYSDVKKSYFSINVYYENLKYTLINQKAKMELVDLVSNVGGIWSAFCGMSFLSFFEIVELVTEFIFIFNE